MERSRSTPESDQRSVAAGIAARAAQIAAMFALIALLLFGAAGTLDWAWGWLYLAIYLASVAVNAWLLRGSPELIAERGRPAESAPRWDAALGGIWAAAQFAALPLVAGLDLRLGWTGPVAAGWHLAGAVVFGAGLALFGWAMVANAYFSTAARLQADRGQRVCRSGPYRLVRHPGYAGAVLQSLGAPLLLGSLWALVPGLVAVAAMAARTRFEDRMLLAGLTGYRDYARDVRFRLVPGVW